jgi:acyl-CoA synthetase (AMP-forming)/AMP-acid ligase II
MSGALAEILRDALKPAGHAVASTGGESQQADGLLELAERVRRALADRTVAPHEPIHISIGNRPSDLGALLGIWQAGAVAVPIHTLAASSTIARVQRISRARFLIDGDKLHAIGNEPPPDRALPRWSFSPRAALETPKASSSDTGGLRKNSPCLIAC